MTQENLSTLGKAVRDSCEIRERVELVKIDDVRDFRLAMIEHLSEVVRRVIKIRDVLKDSGCDMQELKLKLKGNFDSLYGFIAKCNYNGVNTMSVGVEDRVKCSDWRAMDIRPVYVGLDELGLACLYGQLVINGDRLYACRCNSGICLKVMVMGMGMGMVTELDVVSFWDDRLGDAVDRLNMFIEFQSNLVDILNIRANLVRERNRVTVKAGTSFL